LAPDADKRWREILRAFVNPASHVFGGEPITSLDLLRVKFKRAFVPAAVNPDKFLTGFVAGIDTENPLWDAIQFDAKFLTCFPDGARIVVFAGIQMTRSGGIPGAGEIVLFHGAFLQEDFAFGIEDQNVNRAML